MGYSPWGHKESDTTERLHFPGGSMVKNLTANAGDTVQSLSWEDTLKKEMATHTSILAWKIPWTEEPVGYIHGVAKKVRHDLATKQH